METPWIQRSHVSRSTDRNECKTKEVTKETKIQEKHEKEMVVEADLRRKQREQRASATAAAAAAASSQSSSSSSMRSEGKGRTKESMYVCIMYVDTLLSA